MVQTVEVMSDALRKSLYGMSVLYLWSRENMYIRRHRWYNPCNSWSFRRWYFRYKVPTWYGNVGQP